MSSITMPKVIGRGRTVASPSVGAVTPVLHRAAKKQKQKRGDAVLHAALHQKAQEMVKTFELDYAQARAESVEIKAILDARRTQLSDLRRHLEKESSENGTLEAVVHHRASRNDRGDARLRGLEADFERIFRDEELIVSRAAALESDLEVFTAEHRLVRKKLNLAVSHLECAEGSLEEQERAHADGQRESERLEVAVQRWRQVVAERGEQLRREQEQASSSKTLANEAAEEAAALQNAVDELRRELTRKEEDGVEAAADLAALKKQANEITSRIVKDKAARAQGLLDAEHRLNELKQQVSARETANKERDDRIEATERTLAAERTAQDNTRAEINTTRDSHTEAVEGKVRLLSGQLETVDAAIAELEAAVASASDRTRHANNEFSNLMAAMSVAFREYDQAVTSNRELERDAAEAETTLTILKQQSQRDLLLLQKELDHLKVSNEELRVAVEADSRRTKELDAALDDTHKAVDEAQVDIEAKKAMISDSERVLEEARAQTNADDERKSLAQRTAREERTAAEAKLEASRARLEQFKPKLIDLDVKAAGWTPPPAILDEADLRRVEEEVAAAVQKARAPADEVHAKRLDALKETLETIRRGGEARLSAKKEATALRLSTLRDAVLRASSSMVTVRARGEAANQTEATLKLEASRREAEQRLANEARATAAATAAAAAAQEAALAAAAGEATRADAAQAAQVAPERASAVRAAAHQVSARDSTAVPAAEAHVTVGQASATRSALSSWATPEARPTHRSTAAGLQSSCRRPRTYAKASRGGREPSATAPAAAAMSGTESLAVGSSPADCSVTTPEACASPCSSKTHLHTKVADAGPAARPKRKQSRSLAAKDHPLRGQQASESTAEAAGMLARSPIPPDSSTSTPFPTTTTIAVETPKSHKSHKKSTMSSGRKNTGSSNGGSCGGSQKKKGRTSSSSSIAAVASVPASFKPTKAPRQGSSSGGRDRSSRRMDEDGFPERRRYSPAEGRVRAEGESLGGGTASRSGSCRDRDSWKRSSRSKSRSPRHRPRSPRPASTEYDLWTNNTLVDDSDFTFF